MTIGKVELAALAKQAVDGLTTDQALDIANALHKVLVKTESHELRHARWARKRIGQDLGRAATTIHNLRGEVALLRSQKAEMLHHGIDQLIRDAVIEAVPITFNADGSVKGLNEVIGAAELGETEVLVKGSTE